MIVMQPIFLIHENVLLFPEEEFAPLLQYYRIFSFTLHPGQAAYPTRRLRRYWLLVHRCAQMDVVGLHTFCDKT